MYWEKGIWAGYVHEFFLVHEFQSFLGWAFDQSTPGSPPVNIAMG